MVNKRRKFSSDFKVRVVLEALSERQSITELAQKHQIHPNQITTWKREFLDNAAVIFDKSGEKSVQGEDHEAERTRLYRKIGELEMENDFLKKVSAKFVR